MDNKRELIHLMGAGRENLLRTPSLRFIVILAAAVFSLTGCSGGAEEAPADSQTRIAVIRNMPSDDHTKQFLEGCVAEGETISGLFQLIFLTRTST